MSEKKIYVNLKTYDNEIFQEIQERVKKIKSKIDLINETIIVTLDSNIERRLYHLQHLCQKIITDGTVTFYHIADKNICDYKDELLVYISNYEIWLYNLIDKLIGERALALFK